VKDYTKMTLIEIGCEDMDWINLSQDKDSVGLLWTWCWKFAFITLFIVPTDAQYYKIIEMLTQF